MWWAVRLLRVLLCIYVTLWRRSCILVLMLPVYRFYLLRKSRYGRSDAIEMMGNRHVTLLLHSVFRWSVTLRLSSKIYLQIADLSITRISWLKQSYRLHLPRDDRLAPPVAKMFCYPWYTLIDSVNCPL